MRKKEKYPAVTCPDTGGRSGGRQLTRLRKKEKYPAVTCPDTGGRRGGTAGSCYLARLTGRKGVASCELCTVMMKEGSSQRLAAQIQEEVGGGKQLLPAQI